jgi:dihydroorotase
MLTRRAFLHATAATGAATLVGVGDLLAAKYDLVIRGGRVIDPSRRLDRVMDVAVSRGKIAAILPPGTAQDTAEAFDATGRLVLPGLIDVHAHTRSREMPARCLADGVTSLVDGGSRGADQIDEIVAIAKGAPNRVKVLLNVARTGILSEGELLDISQIDVAAARKAIERHRDVIVGVKARISRTAAGTNDLEALRRAQAIVEPFRLRVMVHVGDTVSSMPAILALLKSTPRPRTASSTTAASCFRRSSRPDVAESASTSVTAVSVTSRGTLPNGRSVRGSCPTRFRRT